MTGFIRKDVTSPSPASISLFGMVLVMAAFR